MNYIQYDDVSRTLGANIRFRWQLQYASISALSSAISSLTVTIVFIR